MHNIKHPHFKEGRILKIEMLENFRDYPRDVLDVYNADMSDGIVCGLTPAVDESIITFSKGIVKHKGEVYVFHDPTVVEYSTTETDVAVVLNFHDKVESKDYTTYPVEILLMNLDDLSNQDDVPLGSNYFQKSQIELGRFKLKSGAYLRSDYQDLYDFTTEYNTINVVHVLYAGFGQPTLSHLILKYFAREALNVMAGNNSGLDMNFCMLCLNSRRIEREVILNYIAFKHDKDVASLAELRNADIHTFLVKILDDIKKENHGDRKRQSSRKKVIID